jgi:hypothetical protein
VVVGAKGISSSNPDSQLVANKIVGRRSIVANSNTENDRRYPELGVTSDKKCYMELGNTGAVYHGILSDSRILEIGAMPEVCRCLRPSIERATRWGC